MSRESSEQSERSVSQGSSGSSSGGKGADEEPMVNTVSCAVANVSGGAAAPPRHRLVIRDIDVENFKSYFGQHKIGPFHKTFTAVIGPNGSGKSNVIDAMLFVFGRNAKKIRLEKLAEIIHSSAAHPDVTYASVTVNFVRVLETEEQGRDPMHRVEVPGEALCIKREVFRSGVSQYYVDGKRRTQKEVVDCLIQQGVDLEHNRFLILQGEVEQIALMKPKAEKEGEEGLLEYLDDLIGTNEYVGRISELSKAAESAQLIRLEALDKERKLKAEREALDDAKNSTLAFVTKDNHLQKTLIVMCQIRMKGIEEKLVEPRQLLEEIDQRIKTFEEDVQIRREGKSRAEEEVVRTKKAVAEAVKERDAVRQRKQQAEVQVEQLRSGVDEQERAHKKVLDQIKKCKDEVQKASLQQRDAEREAAIHQQNLEEAMAAAAQLQEKHDELSENLLPQLRPLRHKLEQKKKEFAPFEKAVVEADEQLLTAQARVDALVNAAAKRAEELKAIEEGIERRTERLREIAAMLTESDNGSLADAMAKAQDVLTEATQRKFSINASIQEMKNSYRDGEADDRAMEFLLSQRSLKGYYGTLRQLGRIDDEYDIAAGIASNAWGFHVVEDRATATAALEALKQNNMGRATMMVISEIDREVSARMQRAFTSPNPKAQRLFDMIKPTNPKFRSVFYQAVRDTLVVSTLAEARETAFGARGGGGPPQRHRVVTRKGELVEPNGTITGGGAAPRGAKLKAARSPQDKQMIKEELLRLQQELVQAAEDERATQVQLHHLREKEKRFSADQIRRLRSEHHAVSASVEHDAQRAAALKGELEALRGDQEGKRRKLQAVVDACISELETAKNTRHVQHQAIEKLEEEVATSGGAAFKEVADGLKAQQQRQEAEENALRSCRRLVQKLRATQERKQSDITEHQEHLQKLKNEEEEGAKERVAEAKSQLEELQRTLIAAESTVAKAQSACEDARAAVPVANSAFLEAQKQLEDEHRYRQTEAAKIADALQELAKFEQKIEGCEEKIKENAELYGIETLQLEAEEKTAATQDELDDDEDEDDDNSSSDNENEEDLSQQDEPSGARKRPRSGRNSGEAAKTSAQQIAAMSFRLSAEDLERCDYERSVHLAKALSDETKRLHSEIDFRAVALWRERDLAHRQAQALYMEKKLESDSIEGELMDLKDKRRIAFMAVFEDIRKKLKEVYQLLTHGGDADMELVDANDPFEGVQFVVRPPKKSWKQISNLSGGEKTLSSLALIFSLHHIKPTPIYVMDEIDAALDFRNVSIVANYVLRQATGAQFIIISLRNNMFELAHQLVGVCKVNDVTSTLVLMPRAFQQVVQQAVLGQRRSRGGQRAAIEGGEEEAGDGDGDVPARGLRPSLQDIRLSLSTPDEGDKPPRKSVRFSDDISRGKENALR